LPVASLSQGRRSPECNGSGQVFHPFEPKVQHALEFTISWRKAILSAGMASAADTIIFSG